MPAESWRESRGTLPADETPRKLEDPRLLLEAALRAERRATERFARLHAASAALSAALTTGDVATVAATRGAALPGAVGCAFGILSDDAREIAVVASRGAVGITGNRFVAFSAEGDGPMAVAVREGAPRFQPCEATLPLVVRGRVVGAVALGFAEPRPFEEDERAFLEAFAQQCAQAFERARLFEAERAARLEAQRVADSARRAFELQERLVGIVGHDLRNPLSAVRMATSLLFKRGGLSEEQARTLARLGASAGRMTGIIRDLLDFTRLRKDGTLPVHPRQADLADLVRVVVGELHEVHPERDIRLEVPPSAPVVGDPDRLAQVVSNLVGNALQHGARRTPVRVAVRAEDGGVALDVHNDGPPIAAELLPVLFEPFRHGDRDDASGSVGLGLFVVRELVRAHGGEVIVTSSAAEGTTFTVRLPVGAAFEI